LGREENASSAALREPSQAMGCTRLVSELHAHRGTKMDLTDPFADHACLSSEKPSMVLLAPSMGEENVEDRFGSSYCLPTSDFDRRSMRFSISALSHRPKPLH